MTRTVPGSGAVIKPIFDDNFGVRAIQVEKGGSGYDPEDPPRLTVTGCGTPETEALLYPIIDEASGRIIHVRVLERGRGYDPLRLRITPQQETPNIIDSFDINRIWQRHPNSLISGDFQTSGNPPVKNDRIRLQSDNHPKPSQHIMSQREPGGSSAINDRSFDQVFIYRGGKDVPNPNTRVFQSDKATGILANGGLLHTPGWGADGNVFTGFELDAVKHSYVKDANDYDAVIDNNVYYYQSSKVVDEFALTNGVFEWGGLRQYTWNIKVEPGNKMLVPSSVDETLGEVEVGRIVNKIGSNIRGEIAKIVKDSSDAITRIYIRDISGGEFAEGDKILGSNGFTFTISETPRTINAYYIDFGTSASRFGSFVPGTFYFAPENIRVRAGDLIIFNQSDASNQAGDNGHPIQFSTTPDGVHNSNPGTIYYNSTGSSSAPSTDYENQFAPIFIMNSDETNRIYYFCRYHSDMAGYDGDEGYITINTDEDDDPYTNTYHLENYYQSDEDDDSTIDRSRHYNGHSKILGMSFDGYPIYGPYGYTSGNTVGRMASSYRLKTTAELSGTRPVVNTASTVTYVVTVSDGKFLFDGEEVSFLNLFRGKTYVFDQDDSSNDSEYLLFSSQTDGWHSSDPAVIGNTADLFDGPGFTYHLDGSAVTYTAYIAGFNAATSREIRYEVPSTSPRVLHLFGYSTSGLGVRTVQDGYILGDLTDDYIYDSSEGDLDEYNGKFVVTPDYPNGTYAYFMTEDSSGDPAYPYAIGPKMYGTPLFEGDVVPAAPSNFPTEVEGEVVLTDSGAVSYVKMTRNGDNYFGDATVNILGGEGSGAAGSAIVQTVTGLSLLNSGRSYANPPTLIFEGGGGQGAQGSCSIDATGKVTSVTISDAGEFYQEPPSVLFTGGGGIGAKGVATVFQGEVTGITVTDPGKGYTSPPNIVFTKLINLKRKTRARQAFNSSQIYITGLVKDLDTDDTEIFVNSTDAYPGSGNLIIGTETISYTSKVAGKFSGVTRGVNFNYDQRVILDDGQDDANGNSTYEFNVGDVVLRRIESSNNKLAKVYDWNPATRELLVTFEVDELAFIDAGIPSTEDAIVQFDAGVAASSGTGVLPHTTEAATGETITLLTNPISTFDNRQFVDVEGDVDADGNAIGDDIPDLINTGTDFAGQINLDGGIYDSLYGIEETQGGTNTTLFAVGDNVKDASTPFKYATITSAGGLNEGVEHTATMNIYLDLDDGNGQNYSLNEVVTGAVSGVTATVVSWTASTGLLVVQDVTRYNTGDVNKGIGGYLYTFSEKGTITDFVIQDAGTNYTAAPTVTIEDTGDIQATATVNLTAAGDQVESLTITNGGYGIPQTVDGSYNLHPTVTFTNDASDTTGSGAVASAILGGEKLTGNGGASYRIKRIDYLTSIRSETA